MTKEEYFWSRVDKRSNMECWPWKGAKFVRKGYGALRFNGKTMIASRVAYQLTFGPIPDGMFVLHKCDNPPCCNPDHLWIGTNTDNVKDMDVKGRRRTVARHGEACGASKLKLFQVMEIRSSSKSSRVLAREYGVTKSTILRIRCSKTWSKS